MVMGPSPMSQKRPDWRRLQPEHRLPSGQTLTTMADSIYSWGTNSPPASSFTIMAMVLLPTSPMAQGWTEFHSQRVSWQGTTTMMDTPIFMFQIWEPRIFFFTTTGMGRSPMLPGSYTSKHQFTAFQSGFSIMTTTAGRIYSFP